MVGGGGSGHCEFPRLMKTAWHRFLAPLTPGVRVLLLLLTIMYLAAFVGVFSRAYNLDAWLALSGTAFWSGKVWRIATYVVLPASLLDFLFNWMVILFIGIWIERVWSDRRLWTYCLVCTLGAGLAKVLLQPASPQPMVGTMPMVFGLLAASAYLFGHEKILLWFIWEVTVRQAAILLAVLGAVLMLPCAGLMTAAIMLCGGLTGLGFLWLQSKFLHARASRPVVSERMGRLEL